MKIAGEMRAAQICAGEERRAIYILWTILMIWNGMGWQKERSGRMSRFLKYSPILWTNFSLRSLPSGSRASGASVWGRTR